MVTANKVIEFKLYLTDHQKKLIDEWLAALTWVWNSCCALIEWDEHQLRLKAVDDFLTEQSSLDFLSEWGFTGVNKSAPTQWTTYDDPDSKKKKGFALYTPRVTYQKISINEYKNYQDYESSICKDWRGKDIVVYTDHPKLEQGQFIERRHTKKGIQFYLATPGIWPVKDHYTRPSPLEGDSKGLGVGHKLSKVFAGYNIFGQTKSITTGSKQKNNLKTEIVVGTKMEGVPDEISKILKTIPQKYINCLTFNIFGDAWKAFKKGVRKKPRFKSKGKKVKTLRNLSANEQLKVLGMDFIKIPGFDSPIKVKGLSKRMQGCNKISVYQITKKASGYYLQLTGDFNVQPSTYLKKYKIRPNGEKRAIGLDAGVTYVYTDDTGNEKRNEKRQEDRIDLTPAEEKRLCRLKRQRSRKEHENRKRGKPIVSNNHRKLNNRIARIEERQARRRRAWDHAVSTHLVRAYDAIFVEDLNLQNMTKASKTKVDEAGNYAKVNRKAKAGLNRRMLAHTHGQRASLIESKCEEVNEIVGDKIREFVKVEAKYSSQECRVCGHTEKANRDKEKFECKNCGHSEHADTHAARNIVRRGLSELERVYRAWAWDVKPVGETLSVEESNSAGEMDGTCASPSVRQEALDEQSSGARRGDIPPNNLISSKKKKRESIAVQAKSSNKTSQTLEAQSVELSAGSQEDRAIVEQLTLFNVEQTNCMNNVNQNLDQKRTKKRSAPRDDPNQTQLEFWDAADEV